MPTAGAALSGCLIDAPLPDLGPCSAPPEGVFEYGEVGIHTCLAGPVSLQLLEDGHTLAVDNANPYRNFTGGSVSFLDLDALDLNVDRNLVSDVAVGALDMPSFNGTMAYLPDRDLLAITNKYSADSRTREEPDALYFVDASDPTAPAFDTALGPDGGSIEVGYDPNSILADEQTGYLFVTNRTSHEIAMVDTSSAPAVLVPPGGPARMIPDAFEDVDRSGSRAGFVALETTDAELIDPHAWTAQWSVGTVTAWVPDLQGIARLNSNGEGLWVPAPQDHDIDLAEEDSITEVTDPSVSVVNIEGENILAMSFMSDGYVREAASIDRWYWDVNDSVYLGPDDSVGESVIGGPFKLQLSDGWLLFYDGGDGVSQSIHVAISVDNATYDRTGVAVLSPPDTGTSYEDPFILYDSQVGLWRMWFTVVSDGTSSIGQAYSDDLGAWTMLDSVYTPPGGASGPAVAYYGGAFHLYTASARLTRDVLESVSVDGVHWTEAGVAFQANLLGAVRPRVALLAAPEDTFTLYDDAGSIYPEAIAAGAAYPNTDNGWVLQTAVGQWIDPADYGDDAQGGVRLDSVLPLDGGAPGSLEGWVTLTDDAGVHQISGVTYDAATGAITAAPAPLLTAGAAGGFDADGVSSPVVLHGSAGYVMYYAGVAEGVTSIGRATSQDGATWVADPEPVLVPELDFEVVAIEPGSAWLGDDGTVHLYYTGYDGSRQRIAEAEGALAGGALTRLPGPDHPYTLDAGAPGEWHDSGVAWPWVVVDGDVERMWFGGSSGSEWALGYAERTGGGDWEIAADRDGTPRPVLEPAPRSFGTAGLIRPVVVPGVDSREDGWTVWFTGLDGATSEVGRAAATDPDRLWRDLRLPTLADSWGFTSVPANEGDAIPMDIVVDGKLASGVGCTDLVSDPLRGFIYVMCKAAPVVYVVDVRDDSAGDFQDLNYLGIESIFAVQSSEGLLSVGLRDGMIDPVRPWLWGLESQPAALWALDLTEVADDSDTEITFGAVVASMAAPSAKRDAGPDTAAAIGPGQMALHPDQAHLFVSNFNDNSVSCYDLTAGGAGALVAQADNVGENPYALTVTPDGKWVIVANYAGDVEDDAVSSTLVILDADPASPTFMQKVTSVVNK